MQRMWGKYFVAEETEEISEKTTCKGNQRWTARLVENIFKTGKTEDTPQKTTCTGHSGVAQFVENILDLEETEDTPEKMTCTGIQHWLILLKTFECWKSKYKDASQLLYLTSKSLLTQFLKMQIIFVCPVEIQPVWLAGWSVIENCQEYYFAKLKPSPSWAEL